MQTGLEPLGTRQQNQGRRVFAAGKALLHDCNARQGFCCAAHLGLGVELVDPGSGQSGLQLWGFIVTQLLQRLLVRVQCLLLIHALAGIDPGVQRQAAHLRIRIQGMALPVLLAQGFGLRLPFFCRIFITGFIQHLIQGIDMHLQAAAQTAHLGSAVRV